MSNQISVSEVKHVLAGDLHEHFTGSWVEFKMENWKEGYIVLANIGPEDPKKLWDNIQHILGGRYGARSVHHDIVDGKRLFVVINVKNYDDGRTSVRDHILQKNKPIDLNFLKEPAVRNALLEAEKHWKKWFCI